MGDVPESLASSNVTSDVDDPELAAFLGSDSVELLDQVYPVAVVDEIVGEGRVYVRGDIELQNGTMVNDAALVSSTFWRTGGTAFTEAASSVVYTSYHIHKNESASDVEPIDGPVEPIFLFIATAF